MFLGIIACLLLFIVAGTSVTNISLSNHLFKIYKNPSLSNSASILSVCLKLVLVFFIVYTICVLFIV